MGSPALFGGSNISTLLQGALAMNGGALVNSNGAFNYLGQAALARGLTTGWSLGHVSLTSGLPTGVPTFGSGADANLVLGASSTNPLDPNVGYSLSYASLATNVVGDFVASSALTLRREDQAKVLQFKFAYEVVTGGSAMNFSGTSSNSFGVAIYDVTNSAWIIPAGVFNLVQNSGVGIASGTFQTPSNMTSYRIVIYNVTQVAAVSTMKFGDFFLGPQIIPQGAAMTDLVAYTPTFVGFGTVSNVSVQSQRIGDSLRVIGKFTAGTTTATTASMTLGFNGVNGNVSSTALTAGTLLGKASSDVFSSTYFGSQTVLAVTSSTTVNFGRNTSGVGATTAANGNDIANTGSVVTFEFVVPISGWSCNTSMSPDTDTRVVAALLTGNPPSATSGNPIIFPTASFDTHAGYNSSTGLYTVPVSGYYEVSGYMEGSTSGFAINLYKNGSSNLQMGWVDPSSSSVSYTGGVQCNAGDTLSVRPGGTFDVSANGSAFIRRLSGPATIAATESVTMRAYQTTQSLSNGATNTLIFTTKKFDSHNGYNTSTGIYTVPVSGKYQVSSYIAISGATASAVGLRYDLGVFLNGSLNSYLNTFEYQNNSNTLSGHVGGSTLISCNAGDTINLNIGKDAGIAASSVTTGEPSAWFAIERVGN